MHRTVNLLLLITSLAGAFALYVLRYDARRLEVKVATQERAVKRLEGDIIVLEAEYAHLARPERIEPLARGLGFAPIRGEQYLRLDAGKHDEQPAPGVTLR